MSGAYRQKNKIQLPCTQRKNDVYWLNMKHKQATTLAEYETETGASPQIAQNVDAIDCHDYPLPPARCGCLHHYACMLKPRVGKTLHPNCHCAGAASQFGFIRINRDFDHFRVLAIAEHEVVVWARCVRNVVPRLDPDELIVRVSLMLEFHI